MSWLRYQWQLFSLAISFFTRIPVSETVPFSTQRMNQSGRYFPLVGMLLALLCGGSFQLMNLVLPTDISLFLSMVLSLMLTGAFHEDGLADMADGIGGGMTPEKRLTIMKDSRVGTYGSVTLIMALVGKFVLLKWLFDAGEISVLLIWFIGYTTSRAVASSLIFNTPYVSDLSQSKSKPLAQQQSRYELLTVMVTGLLPCVFLSPIVAVTIVLVNMALRSVFKRWLMSRLGGFTGDCLGALQQISELVCYLILVAFIHNHWMSIL